jgi:hypothetical protein
MAQPASPFDGAIPLTRREVLRLGAASAAVPLIAHTPISPGMGEQPAPVTGPSALEGEDHPEARAKTIDNLKILGIALLGFAARNNGRFPPAAIRRDGKPLLSWRVAILPFLDIYRDARLYRQFRLEEPWDNPHNKALLKEMPPEYAPIVRKGQAPYSTYYQGFVGPGALFDGEKGTRNADVTDGVGWTLMVVEAAEPVPWTKPEDVRYHRGKPLPKIGGQFKDGAYAAFADGSARFLSSKVAPETLHALISRGDGEVITFDKLGPWRRPRPDPRESG